MKTTGFAAAMLIAGTSAAAGERRDAASVVRAMFDAFNRHDAAAMVAAYAPHAELLSPDFCAPRRGREDVRRTYQALFDEAPDIVDTVDEMVVQGDRVAVLFHSRGTAGGQPFDVPIAAFITVSDGLIVRDRSVFQPSPSACLP